MIAFFVIVCVLVGLLALILYVLEVKYFETLTGYCMEKIGKLSAVFLIIIFFISVSIGFIFGKYGFLAGKNSLLIIFYMNFLVFFVASYYYCCFINRISKFLKVKNQTLIATLGFIPTFFLSNIFLGTMIGTFFLK